MSRIRASAMILSVTLGLPFAGPVRLALAGEAADATLTLDFHHAPWNASALGHEISGRLGWLEGPEGSLRFELGKGPREIPPGHLLTQTGDGWTLVLGPEGKGTVNSWGREWQKVEPGLGALAVAAVDFLSSSENGPASRRIVIPELGTTGEPPDPRRAFRRDLVQRGRGRGGAGEIVVLQRLAPGENPMWTFEIRSTRRPGRIRIGSPVPMPLNCPVPEVFVPLWPLSSLTQETEEKPGTSSPGEG